MAKRRHGILVAEFWLLLLDASFSNNPEGEAVETGIPLRYHPEGHGRMKAAGSTAFGKRTRSLGYASSLVSFTPHLLRTLKDGIVGSGMKHLPPPSPS